MSKAPASETDHPDGLPDRQVDGLPDRHVDAMPDRQVDGLPDRHVDAMKDQLRKDVASWSAARTGASVRQADEFSVPAVQVARQPSPQPAKRVRRAKPAPPDVKDSGQKKPFRMSYDGVTQADYITYMIARGTR